MKKYFITFTCSLGALLLMGGCATEDVRTAQRLVTVDVNPGQANKGYVEFYPGSSDALFPVYYVDPQGRLRLLANMGVKHGDSYDYDVHGAPAGEKIRVALPAGTHRFRIDNGPDVHVPVLADKLTTVGVDYSVVDRITQYVVYRADARPSAPGPFIEETPASPKK